MIFTTEQLKALEPYENYFTTAIRSRYARYPGANGVRVIHDIYSQAVKGVPSINASCSSCIFRLLTEVGTLYFKDKEELEKQAEQKQKKTRKKS
jgi:hypothetical protein